MPSFSIMRSGAYASAVIEASTQVPCNIDPLPKFIPELVRKLALLSLP